MSSANILFVVIDCARSDKWLGPGRTTVTPNLDRLCREGISHPNLIAEKSFTLPAFSTLLTGSYSYRHGVHLAWGYRLPESQPLLTHRLAERGYTTYAEVTGPLLPETGLDRAFNSFEYRAPSDSLRTAWGDRLVARLRAGHYRQPWFLLLHLFELHKPQRISPAYDRAEFGRTRYERAVSGLDAELGRLFSAAGDDALIVVTGDHGEKTEEETFEEGTAVSYFCGLLDMDRAKGMPLYRIAYWGGPSVLQQVYSRFAPDIRALSLSEIQKKLKFGRAAGFWDKVRLLWLLPRLSVFDLLGLGKPLRETAILNERGLLDERRARQKVERFAKFLGRQRLLEMQIRMWVNSYRNNITEGHGMHVYDYLVRVPLVMRWPRKLPASVVQPQMVRQPDLLPTVVDLIGAAPESLGLLDGRSFKPLIEGKPWVPKPAFLSVSGGPPELELHGLRTEDHKYTFGPYNPEIPEELYDLRQDPAERRNLAGQEPGLCAFLRRITVDFVRNGEAAKPEPLELRAKQRRAAEDNLKALGYLD